MSGDRLEVNVTFDERGYIGSAPELRSPVVALSLGGLRRRIEALLLPNEVEIVLQLDGLAERTGAEQRWVLPPVALARALHLETAI
jgi:hypothetical protein